MNKDKFCNHKTDTGRTSLVFSKEKFLGIANRKYQGFCTICGSTVELSQDEYKKISKERSDAT